MNRIILIGNLAKDPEVHTTQGGITVCKVIVACNRRVPNAQGVREADFIPVIAWREKGEFVARHFTKGKKIAVEGYLQVRSYEAKDGTKRTVAEVIADNVEFVEKRETAPTNAPKNARFMPPPPDDFEDVDDESLPF